MSGTSIAFVDPCLGVGDPSPSARDLGMAFVDLEPGVGDLHIGTGVPHSAFVDLGPSIDGPGYCHRSPGHWCQGLSLGRQRLDPKC